MLLSYIARGYGQILRNFLQDNNISYEDIRFKFDEWPAKRDEIIAANKMPAATAPYIETADGTCYGRTLPILRRLSKDIPGTPLNQCKGLEYAMLTIIFRSAQR